MLFCSFYHDFGPYNLSVLYRFCIKLHPLLKQATKRRPVVFCSATDNESRVNCAFLAGKTKFFNMLSVHFQVPMQSFMLVPVLMTSRTDSTLRNRQNSFHSETLRWVLVVGISH